jgi:hypothetical protein
MEAFLGKDHIYYKKYIEQFNIVIDAIDEIAFLSNTLDYERLVVFFKEVVEIFEFFKNIDENDDNSEGFSNMTNKDDLFLSIIDSNEYNNLIKFMETYRETIIRKSDNLKEKITGLLEFKSLVNPSNPNETSPNQYIKVVYDGNVELIQAKMEDISDKLKKNIDDELLVIDEKKVKFDIKLITKNDMICILSSYRLLKMLVYKQMHVIDREYYTATKEDVLEFRKELYDIYTMLCEHFNREKNLYVEDIHTKFLEVVEVARDLKISKTDGAGEADAAKADEKTDEKTADAAKDADAGKAADVAETDGAGEGNVGKAANAPPVRVAAPPVRVTASRVNEDAELINLAERMKEQDTVEAQQVPPAAAAPPPAAQARAEAEAKLKGVTDTATQFKEQARAEAEAKLKGVTDTATQFKEQTEARFKKVSDDLLSLKSITKRVGAKDANGASTSPFDMFAQLSNR